MKATVAAFAVLLGACTQADEAQTPAPAPTAEVSAFPGETPGEIPQSIVGEYRLAGIDGEDMNSPVGIAVSIGIDTIHYEPRCLGSAWTYTLRQGELKLERDTRFGPQKNKDGSIVTCLPAVTPEYGRLSEAFAVAERVRRMPSNALEFSGGGHSVTLFSQ